jgi:transposase InsO family protein
MSRTVILPLAIREEFVRLAEQRQVEMKLLCQRYEISLKTGYQWLRRFRAGGREALVVQSRRPQHSPRRTAVPLEQAVLAVRDAHPAWGGRKISAYLHAQGTSAVPSPSTITAILHRHERVNPATTRQHRPWQRFEQDAPNRLWQMDFKGHFAIAHGRCHPLTVLDDHSRFALCLRACADEQGATVKRALTDTFRHYGLPERLLMDNGGPWGHTAEQPLTKLTVWLIHLGIGITHGHPYHPQTQGKDERFHRTLNAEVLRDQCFLALADCQQAFDRWRHVYNLERPHQALNMMPPISRYQPSPVAFPETLPAIDYGPDDCVRQVQDKGEVHFQGRLYTLSAALHGYPVAFRPATEDGHFDIYFCHYWIKRIDLREPG